MKRVTDLLTALVFISLIVFISCKKGDDGPSGPTPEEEQAELFSGTWPLESATLGTTNRTEWTESNFSLTVEGNEDGGTITANNVPNIDGASDVWPSPSDWSFGSSITQINREADGIVMNITLTESTLIV